MADDQIVCMDCGQTFTFTEEEKTFYAQKGFVQPKRCPVCRKKKKAASRRPGDGGPKQTYDVTCCDCGCATQVPFKPKEGLPVYCKDCFLKRKGSKTGKASKTTSENAKDIPTIPESKDTDDKGDNEKVEMESFDEDSDDFEDDDGTGED